MQPLSKGFGALQSGTSSLARFLFLPPVGWAGLGRGWAGGDRVASGTSPGARGGPVALSLCSPFSSLSSYVAREMNSAEITRGTLCVSHRAHGEVWPLAFAGLGGRVQGAGWHARTFLGGGFWSSPGQGSHRFVPPPPKVPGGRACYP